MCLYVTVRNQCLCCECCRCSCIRTLAGHTRKSVLLLLSAAVSCSMKYDQQHVRSSVRTVLSNLHCWDMHQCLAGSKLCNRLSTNKQNVKVFKIVKNNNNNNYNNSNNNNSKRASGRMARHRTLTELIVSSSIPITK